MTVSFVVPIICLCLLCMPSITYASSLEVEVYSLVVDVGLNYVTVNYQSTSLLSTFHSSYEAAGVAWLH